MRALVIDDSKAMRMIIIRIMQELGFDVCEAANGREGLAHLRQNDRVDVALVDWNMPEMDGLAFIRAVRAEEAYRDLCLMMVTTETELVRVQEALEAGADEYIMKPFDKEMLLEKLALLGIDID